MTIHPSEEKKRTRSVLEPQISFRLSTLSLDGSPAFRYRLIEKKKHTSWWSFPYAPCCRNIYQRLSQRSPSLARLLDTSTMEHIAYEHEVWFHYTAPYAFLASYPLLSTSCPLFLCQKPPVVSPWYPHVVPLEVLFLYPQTRHMKSVISCIPIYPHCCHPYIPTMIPMYIYIYPSSLAKCIRKHNSTSD